MDLGNMICIKVEQTGIEQLPLEFHQWIILLLKMQISVHDATHVPL